jgi:hypothetical protein
VAIRVERSRENVTRFSLVTRVFGAEMTAQCRI